MPRKSAFKCYFGCIPFTGKVHHFPSQEYPYTEKFDQWKIVLSEIDREKGDNYIYNNIRICDHHFEEFYRTASGRLTKNAVPTLNIGSNSRAVGPICEDLLEIIPIRDVSVKKDHDNLPKECLGTADLLLVVDKLFDSFNGHNYQTSDKMYKCALKRNSPHFKLWDDLLPILRSM